MIFRSEVRALFVLLMQIMKSCIEDISALPIVDYGVDYALVRTPPRRRRGGSFFGTTVTAGVGCRNPDERNTKSVREQ